MTLSFCVYGPGYGFGSFRAITLGFLEGLRGLGQRVAFMPTDLHDDESPPPQAGTSADVGVWLGSPAGCAAMKFRAHHRRRFVMVAPNSDVTPAWVFQKVREADAELLTPSQWGARMLEPFAGRLPITVVPHGLRLEFLAPRPAVARGEGRLKVLHMTSTARQRKGTAELINAWRGLHEQDALEGATLDIVTTSDQALHLWTGVASRKWMSAAPDPAAMRVIGRLNIGFGSMADFYRQYDLVVQPSRAEGFGLTPLEALACGVPVVATTCTGHTEYLDGPATPGLVPVAHGAPQPIDDGEGATAPLVTPKAIAEALCTALLDYPVVREDARRWRQEQGSAWSWSSVLRPWVESLEESSSVSAPVR